MWNEVLHNQMLISALVSWRMYTWVRCTQNIIYMLKTTKKIVLKLQCQSCKGLLTVPDQARSSWPKLRGKKVARRYLYNHLFYVITFWLVMQILYVIPYNLIDCNQTIYLMYFDHEKSCLRSIFRYFSCFFNIIVQSRLMVELYHFVKHGG